MKLNYDPKSVSKYPTKDLIDTINHASSLYQSGHFEKAYPIIITATEYFDSLAKIGLKGPTLNKELYKAVYMLAGDICGELGRFDEALKFYEKHLFFHLQMSHDFQEDKTVSLFQFRNTRAYTLNNLKNNSITLVDPRIQNDIVDSPIFAWINTLCGHSARYKGHISAFKAAFNYIRATSFCTDSHEYKAVENTLMWAHYANCHKGICVQYELGEKDFSSNTIRDASITRLMRIKYVDPREKEAVIDFSNDETKLSIRTALATKSIDWNYENEVRMIAYAPTEQSKFVPYVFETPNPIKAIYFGVKCPTQRKNAVRAIFENRPEVAFYQMKINPQNIHRLIFDPC